MNIEFIQHTGIASVSVDTDGCSSILSVNTLKMKCKIFYIKILCRYGSMAQFVFGFFSEYRNICCLSMMVGANNSEDLYFYT